VADHARISELALNWLRHVLRTEHEHTPAFAEARRVAAEALTGAASRLPAHLVSTDPFEIGARFVTGDVTRARWYREWHRRWRRFHLPARLASFGEELLQARRPEDVFRALTENAVRIVGGYTCVLYPPQASTPLRPLANPLLRVDAGRLTLTLPLPAPGAIRREQIATGGEEGAFSELAPLFAEDQAVSLAHAPFGDGGVILVVERRTERVFTANDWETLRLLAVLANAALARVEHTTSRREFEAPDPAGGILPADRLTEVVGEAIALAEQGDHLAVVCARLTGLADIDAVDGDRAGRRTYRSAADALTELAGALGAVVQRGTDGFWIVLPRLSGEQAIGLVERLRPQLPLRARLVLGAAEYAVGMTPAVLLDSAAAVLREGRQRERDAAELAAAE
jgi:GGDEF domain-containing protein